MRHRRTDSRDDHARRCGQPALRCQLRFPSARLVAARMPCKGARRERPGLSRPSDAKRCRPGASAGRGANLTGVRWVTFCRADDRIVDRDRPPPNIRRPPVPSPPRFSQTSMIGRAQSRALSTAAQARKFFVGGNWKCNGTGSEVEVSRCCPPAPREATDAGPPPAAPAIRPGRAPGHACRDAGAASSLVQVWPRSHIRSLSRDPWVNFNAVFLRSRGSPLSTPARSSRTWKW